MDQFSKVLLLLTILLIMHTQYHRGPWTMDQMMPFSVGVHLSHSYALIRQPRLACVHLCYYAPNNVVAGVGFKPTTYGTHCLAHI